VYCGCRSELCILLTHIALSNCPTDPCKTFFSGGPDFWLSLTGWTIFDNAWYADANDFPLVSGWFKLCAAAAEGPKHDTCRLVLEITVLYGYWTGLTLLNGFPFLV